MIPPCPPPMPMLGDSEPRMIVQRTGTRESGYMAWEAWVEVGPTKFAREYGTYAWTRKGAERKAARLLRSYLRSRPGPRIEVGP